MSKYANIRMTIWMLTGFSVAAHGFLFSLLSQPDPEIPSQEITLRYPDDAGVIDVTKAPYFAKGDGITDDTAAINAALKDWNGAGTEIGMSHTIYFPKGTYLVSDTLVPLDPTNLPNDQSSVRMLGESRSETVIKLKNNAAGYGTVSSPKYLIKTGNYPVNFPSPGQPNSGYGNYIQNLTIDTGSGNPGAVGVRYDVANFGTLKHVNIISSDANLRGHSGILFHSVCGAGYVKDVRIEGFNYGIYFDNVSVNNIVFEHLSLIGQKVCGILNQGKNIQIRKLTSTNSVPALIMKNPWAVTVLLDAHLVSPASGSAVAIDVQDNGFLFARDVTVDGYERSIGVSAESSRGSVFGNIGSSGWVSHDYTRSNSVKYSFEGVAEYAPARWRGEELSVSDIEYIQGTVASGEGDSGVAYESNIISEKFFALSSKDIGNVGSNFNAEASRFVFDVTINDNAVSFSNAFVEVKLAAIQRNDQAGSYSVTAVPAWKVNGGEWRYLYDERSSVSVSSNNPAVNQVLNSSSSNQQLGGYTMGNATINSKMMRWELDSLGTVFPGDQIQFAIFVFDGKNNHNIWWACADDIQLSGWSRADASDTAYALSLNLPVKDAPEYHNDDFSEWANVRHYGAIADDGLDDADSIQAAIDSGKKIIYFPRGVYNISKSVYVRGAVRKIDGIFSMLTTAKQGIKLILNNVAGDSFILENVMTEKIEVVFNSTNQVAIRHKPMAGIISCGSNASGDLFIEDAGPHVSVRLSNGVHAWIRQLNRESAGLTNDGATLWLLGDNIERMFNQSSGQLAKNPILTKNGGVTEILGGALDPLQYDHFGSARGMVECSSGSRVSAVYAGEIRSQDGIPGQWYRHVIDETPAGTFTLYEEDTIRVLRSPGTYRFFLPPYKSPGE